MVFESVNRFKLDAVAGHDVLGFNHEAGYHQFGIRLLLNLLTFSIITFWDCSDPVEIP